MQGLGPGSVVMLGAWRDNNDKLCVSARSQSRSRGKSILLTGKPATMKEPGPGPGSAVLLEAWRGN